MKNTLTSFLEGLPDQALVTAIKELSDFHDTGILCDGVVRMFAGIITSAHFVPREHAINIVEKYCYRMAAEKWAKIVSTAT